MLTKVNRIEYFTNPYIFTRPMISTEYIDSESKTYSSFYPNRDGWNRALEQMMQEIGFDIPFSNLQQDIDKIIQALQTLDNRMFTDAKPNLQIQVIRNPFFRNKGAYILGKIINAHHEYPFAIPVLHKQDGIFCDTILLQGRHLGALFSFNRAYFLMDCEVPSTLVQFLSTILPQNQRQNCTV